METLSLTQYLATKIEENRAYTVEALAEEILESVEIKIGKNEKVWISCCEGDPLYNAILDVLKNKIEEKARKLVEEWDEEAEDYSEEKKRGLGGRY